MLHIEVTQADITKSRKLFKPFMNDDTIIVDKICPVAVAVARKQKKKVEVGSTTISLCNGRSYVMDEKGQNFINRFDNNKRVRPIKFTALQEKE